MNDSALSVRTQTTQIVQKAETIRIKLLNKESRWSFATTDKIIVIGRRIFRASFLGGTMSEVLEKEKTEDSLNHVCIMQMVSNADQDTGFFWNQLFDSCDDE